MLIERLKAAGVPLLIARVGLVFLLDHQFFEKNLALITRQLTKAKMETKITLPARDGWSICSFQRFDYSKFVEEYLDWKASYTKSAKDAYRLWVERFQAFANKSPKDITLADVAAFRSYITPKYAEKNVWYGMTIVRNYLRYLKEVGKSPIPIALVRVPRGYANSHYSVSEDEYRRMIEALKTKRPDATRDRLIVRLLHDTGMRVGELYALDIDDMHEDMSATIRTEKTTQHRRVFWNPDTEQDLQNYLVERTKISTESDALFLSSSNQNAYERLSSRGIQRAVKKAKNSAGITNDVTPHSFRHAFIHRLALRGVPDSITSVLVGHSTSQTVTHYTKLCRTEYEQAFRGNLAVAA
jgi:integrase/recombinase XerD